MKLKNLSVIYYLSLFAIIALGFLNPTNRLDLMLEIMLVGYILWIIKKGKDLTNKFFFKPFSVTACLSIPFILVFLVTSWRNSLELRTYLIHEPVSETYRSDLDDFLKTYYLMQRGQEYYLSFSQAVTENAFKGYVAQNLWAWRMPTVFYFWKMIPGPAGISIYVAFLLLAALALHAVYRILARLLPETQRHLGILAPYMFYPYLHFAARDRVLLHTEWWAVFFMLFAIYGYVSKKPVLFMGCLLIALLMRELFIIPVGLAGIWFWLKKDKTAVRILITIGGFGLFFVLHSLIVKRLMFSTATFASPRVHVLGKDIILSTLAFGAWEYFFFRIRIFLVFYVLAVFGLVRHLHRSYGFLLCFVLMPVSFLILGSSIYNDYWGIFYLPFVLISVPLILV